MSLQILTLKLDGITAGDYLTWCRDPDPPALDYGSVRFASMPTGLATRSPRYSTNKLAPAPPAAATAAGLPLSQGAQIQPQPATGASRGHGDRRFAWQLDREDGKRIALAMP